MQRYAWCLQVSPFAGPLFEFPGDVHFFGGIFNDEGMPIDLAYTPVMQYLEWLQGFNNYNSNFLEYDIAAIHCNEIDVPYDDYLAEIAVPVFFVGAGGSWGDLMGYTASLLTGSDDVSILNVSVNSERLLDIGHVDIFTAENSPQLFWQPIFEWINDHSCREEVDAPQLSAADTE